MFKRFLTVMSVVAAGLAFAPAASAGIAAYEDITLDDTVTTDKYQQTTNSPCIVGQSCSNPAGWEDTTNSDMGNAGYFDAYSPTYTVDQILSVTDNLYTFIIAMDINTAGPEGAPTWGADEDLILVEMCVGGDASGEDTSVRTDNSGFCEGDGQVVQAYYAPDGSIDLHDYKHGNGESDSLLAGWDLLLYETLSCGNELCELTGDTNVQFRVVYENSTNGFETFFIVGSETPPVLPEPSVLGLLGAGLVGLGFATRRRRKKVA